MKNMTYDFHGTKMTIRVLTNETNGMYSIIHFAHPSNVGPALHFHPNGPETFQIIEGTYRFSIGEKSFDAKTGDIITVPKGIPHKFKSGDDGGKFLVTSPPNLENYFYEVSQILVKGKISFDAESEIAKKYGQIFLENANHWENKSIFNENMK